VTEAARGLFGRVDAMYRYLVMNYQLGVVGKAIDALDRAERRQLVELADKKANGGNESARTSAEAFGRVRSSNAQMRLHGIVQWISAITAETRESPNGDFQEINQRTQRLMRQVRDSLPRPATRAA
jgi:hypothetical protein